MSIIYHDGNRQLQDRFDSRRISDRLEEKLTRTAFNDDDKAFIEGATYFFLATADAGAWRRSCPHLSIWEDTISDGLVRFQNGSSMGQSLLVLTARGRALLDRR